MKTVTLFTVLMAVIFLPVTPVNAASEDECTIWLCLPAGFPSGCGAAKSAFKKRLRKLKSPLPNFASCVVSSGHKEAGEASTMEATHGYAAYIPPRKVCTEWRSQHDDRTCVRTEIVPSQIIKDTRCRWGNKDHDYTVPRHCATSIKYTDIYMDGQIYGETNYYDNSGNEYHAGVTKL